MLAFRPVAEGGSLLGDLRDGWRFVRGHAWLWATFASAAVAYLLFMGPVEVLLPWIVKEGMGGSAFDLGLVFAAGGPLALGAELAVPRRIETLH